MRNAPKYTINLALPPEERYIEVAHAFKSVIQDLTVLFDEVTSNPWVPSWIIHFFARILLRRLYSAEQTAELRGISAALDVPLYLLVASNVFLDLMMGCTSGGVLTRSHAGAQARMMHFRTLDWGMPALRRALVQLDFVETPDGNIVASTIGYVGFVGVLTGVKQGLSCSLNFRPYRDDGSILGSISFYWHLVLVVLGFRPSICAVLRELLMSNVSTPQRALQDGVRLELREQINTILPEVPSTAAYLIFCTTDSAMVLEKDLRTARITHSSTFIAAGNHDAAYQDQKHQQRAETRHLDDAIQGIVEMSTDRTACLRQKWVAWRDRELRKTKEREDTTAAVTLAELKRWVLEQPVCNEETHFACIMDPGSGKIRWNKCFEEGEIEGMFVPND